MSKKVDERVVEMRFDNKDFESNVKTTMSTLDKLKAALKLPTSSNALSGVANAAKNSTSNISGLGSAVETVNARFSALQVVGMTALSNITSAAMRAGSNLVKSFTIAPITAGFQEYETQLNAVQTILANTQSKGTTLADVNAALDELNRYADLTIYNFTEMTRNIGTFTAAGVDLETSVSAIQGIANLAAVSGSTSQQASTAMYQLSQALAAGRVTLMDWNSVVNAGMGGEVFQNALKRTAEVMGTDVDALIKKYGSFRESLTSGEWLTTDVLTKTLEQFTMAAEEGSEEWENFKKSLMEEGYTAAQAEEILRMANTATDAATKVKTFTQLMDTLSEAAGSGWAKTWQLIFGDFEEAKEFWTGLSDTLSGLINTMSDARNAVIEGAMDMGGSGGWTELSKKITDAGVSIEDFQKKLSEVLNEQGISLDGLIKEYGSLAGAMTSGKISADSIIETLKRLATSTDVTGQSTEDLNEKLVYFQDVVDRVWRGDFKNAPERFQLLAEAGYDYAKVQELVNATVDGHRLTLEDLSDAQLISIGYTEEEVTQIRALAEEAEKAGTPLNELINSLSKKSGRELFLESLTNLLYAVLNPLQAVATAFSNVFAIDSTQLYGVIEAFNAFTQTLVMDEATIDNLTRTLQGFFSIIHIVATFAGKTFTAVFTIANSILHFFGTNLLEVTAFIGDLLTGFDKWITSGTIFEDTIRGIGDALKWAAGPISDFFAGFAELPAIQGAMTAVRNFVQSVKDYIKSFDGLNPGDTLSKFVADIQSFFSNLTWDDVIAGLRNFGEKVREIFGQIGDKLAEVGPDIIAGLQNGLSGGWDSVVSFLTDIASKLVEAVKAVLGIHSPSTVFFDIGKNIIEGLVNGIKFISGNIADTLIAILEDVKDVIGTIDWAAILTVAAGAGTFVIFYKISDALQSFGNAVETLTSPLEVLEDLEKSFSKVLDAKALELKSEAVKNLAIGVAILAASVFVLAQLDPVQLWSAVGALFVMAAVLAGLTYVMNQFGKSAATTSLKDKAAQLLDISKIAGLLLSIGTSLLMLAGAIAILGSMDQGQLIQAGVTIAAFMVLVMGLIAITKFSGAKNLDKAGTYVQKVGVALLLMAATAKILGTMSTNEMIQAGIMITVFGGIVTGLIAATMLAGKKIDSAANFISKVGVAFVLLAASAKILGTMSTDEMVRAGIVIAVFGGIVTSLIAATMLAGKKIDQVSNFLAKVGVAFLMLAVTAKLLGTMSADEMVRAGVAILAFTGIITLLVFITKLAPKDQIAQISTTLLAMSASIAILAAVAVLLGYVNPENLAQGIVAVGFLTALVAAMVAVTKYAKDVKGTMMGIAAAIGVMAVSVAVLSFIDPARLAGATVAMTVLMGMFALVAKASSNIQTSMSTMITIAAIIAILAVAVGVLANQPWQGVLASGAALSALLLSLAAACKILSTISYVSSSALQAMGILTAIVVGLAVILGFMSYLNVEASIPTATSISILLVAMAGVTAILSAIGPAAQMAVAGALAMAQVVGILALVIAAVIGVAGLIGQIPGGVEFIRTAGEVLSAIGEAIGSFISGIGVGLTSGLPEMATNLSLFAVGLTPFITTMKMIDSSVVDSATSLAGAILALTATGVIDGLLSFFGIDVFDSLGEKFAQLGSALGSFAESTAGLNGEQTALAAQALANVCNAMASVPRTGGLLDGIFGGQDFSGFAGGMAALGSALASFEESAGDITPEVITPAAEALKTMIDAVGTVPNSGGLLGALLGGQDFVGFATGMKELGTALKNFYEETDGITAESVQPAADALRTVIETMGEVPESGGFLGFLLGEQNFENFASGMKSIGQALKDFNSNVSEIDDFEKLNSATTSLSKIITTMSDIPTDGGWLDNIFGDGTVDYTKFSEGLKGIGTALSDYGTSIGETDLEAVGTSIVRVGSILNMIKTYIDVDGLDSGVTNISKIGGVADAVKNYSDKISGIDSGKISSSVSSIKNLMTAIVDMVGLDTSGIASFQAAIDQLAATNVQGLIDTFSNIDMSSIGANLMTSLASGIETGGDAVTTSASLIASSLVDTLTNASDEISPIGLVTMVKFAAGMLKGMVLVTTATLTVASAAVSSAESFKGEFHTAGLMMASGLAAGIAAGGYGVRQAAYNIAKDAAQAARDAVKVASPSKVFREIGGYMGEGMVIGLNDYTAASSKAGGALGESAIDGLSKAISGIDSTLNSDMDLNPTIRPVLDLTDVKNGASAIDGMLSGSTPLSVLGRVNSIDNLMNSRIQNGSFSDVVSAVDRLRGALDNVGNTTYQVNGVTYDDGSNIAAAVTDLTRAMRIERRV